MIFESSFYKRDLKKETEKISDFFKKSARITSEKRYFEIEKFLFTSAFLIRKLIESNKASDELEGMMIAIGYSDIKNMERVKDYFGKWDFDENYALEVRKSTTLLLKDLLNIIIHSYIIHFYNISLRLRTKNYTQKVEILITSDRKADRIYYLSLFEYIEICKAAYSDNIVHAVIGYKNGRRQIITKSNKSQRDNQD